MADTIAAVATGSVISAIGIIRVSGDDAIAAADSIFRAVCGTRLSDAQNRRLYYGELIGADGEFSGSDRRIPDADSGFSDSNRQGNGADGGMIDLCLCTISRGPNSYTGEDTVEFHCHGSPVVLSEALRSLFSRGVRQALPGEFTKRAFLNGRMDLTQAEAVIDLIESESPSAARNAAGQLHGSISLMLEPVYSALVDIMAHFHAVIDYPDEDIDELDMWNYLSMLAGAEEELSRMLYTHDRGRVLREGIPTAIIGRPNTGKSSLLNALLGYDRVIVNDLPGTTRDTIEEKILFAGALLRLTDTAGLRQTNDAVEKLGVERTLTALRGADIAIVVLDGSEPLRDEDHEVVRLLPSGILKLAVVNKSDLPHTVGDGELTMLGMDYCRICALSGDGFDALEALIKKAFPELGTPPSGELVTNARQADAIARARDSVSQAIGAIEASVTPDALLTDIEDALAAIGEVTGKVMREDIISRIFERFCVGK